MNVQKVFAQNNAADYMLAMPADALKFVVIGDTLIIGSICDHTLLVALALDPINAVAGQITFEGAVRRWGSQVVAAGKANFDGVVTSWISSGFERSTPSEMIPALEILIREIATSESGWGESRDEF